ncbi:DUF3553 domain-containing protein [Actibacterium pelagium]|uniref:DUF3553 domain-containing protein n=1 Tax=Actibacterium pelagium TaxID=2029103 RepID=A0A917EHF5_9RHOB|nr:DUF3553 domain-containing protein [Actibacterium pelagium]GGE44082.1 DUF3553 domain-containing protein [Actibacterium pelagium]
MTSLNSMLEPGMLVRHPDQPDWGLGQVQSNINGRITVNFQEQGKVVIDGSKVALTPVFTS